MDFNRFSKTLALFIFYEVQINYYLTSLEMQTRLKKTGFTNTMSGNLNAKHKQLSKKMLDLQDFDVQMLTPNFLAAKTLKKPIAEYNINLGKTNPSGTRFQPPSRDSQNRSSSLIQESNNKIKNNKPLQPEREQELASQYKYISAYDLNIKPAIRQGTSDYVMGSSPIQLQLKDKNSIISALMRKGQLNPDVPFQIKVIKPESVPQKSGPAQTKLKALFNKKENTLTVQPLKKKVKEVIPSQIEIDEEINESIQQDYGNQQFEKMSGAYESQIKQSIRESIGASSGAIKQSIRESIRDEIPESFKSISKSKQQVKEQIMESKHKQSIEEQVYQQIFEQASISDEISKSRSNKNFKKKQEDKFELSASASKKFRTKTKTIEKSIKFAEELTMQNQMKNTDNKIQQKFEKGDKLAEEIIKQRANFSKLQQKISSILDSHTIKVKRPSENKNLELYYKFKIEINRLMTSENFMSKLRKLTAFIGQNPVSQSGEDISSLQDKLLSNLMERIHDLRVSGVTQQQLSKVKKQYDEKLAYLLKQQEMSLRVEMDKKLHEKDMELKKMIAELEQKFKNTAPINASYFDKEGPKKQFYGDRVQVDSDYSIDSDEISWKMDLWEVLPDYEKKKLYQKQSSEVANFLTEVLMNEIKNQHLDRSADISFQFPEQFNDTQTQSVKSESKSQFSKKNRVEPMDEMRPTLDREQLKKQIGKSGEKSQIFPPLPGVKKSSAPTQDIHEYNIHYMQIPFSKIQQNEGVRDTVSVSEVVKILAKYKGTFVKKKNDLIRKLVKTLQQKNAENEPMSSLINQIRIMNQKEITASDEPYVKAYEEDIIMELISIYNKNKNRKSSTIEQEMRKMYERLVVTCQVKTAEASVRNPNEIIPNETYIEYRMAQQDKKIKDVLVNQICNLLAAQFAKEMPKRKK